MVVLKKEHNVSKNKQLNKLLNFRKALLEEFEYNKDDITMLIMVLGCILIIFTSPILICWHYFNFSFPYYDLLQSVNRIGIIIFLVMPVYHLINYIIKCLKNIIEIWNDC